MMSSAWRVAWTKGFARPGMLTAGLCFVFGLAAFQLVGEDFAPFIFWPPVGLALGATLLRGYRMAPAAAGGVFAAVYWGSDLGLFAAGLLALAVGLQAVLGCALLRQQDFHAELDRVSDLFKLAFFGGFLAVLPALPLLHFALGDLEPLWGLSNLQFTLFAVMGQLASTVVLTALPWYPGAAQRQLNGARWPEISLAFASLALVLLLVVRPTWFGLPYLIVRPYPILPFLLWLALRTNLRLTSIGLLGVYAAMASAIGWGDAFLPVEDLRILPLHGFMATVGLTFLSLSIATDQRNHGEQQLRVSEARFRGIVESSKSWFWAANSGGEFRYVSPQVEAMLGVAPASLSGRGIDEVFDLVSAQRFVSLGNPQPGVSQAALTLEHVAHRPDGSMVSLETSCVPMRDADGLACGCQCITRDVSHIAETRQALLEANIRFQQLTEHTHEVFWIARRDASEFLYVSPASGQMLGLAPGALYREPLAWMSLVHQDDLAIAEAGLASQRKGETLTTELRIVHPEHGIRWVSAQVFPFQDQEGEALVAGILEDVTHRRQAEAERLAYAIAQRETLIREVHHRIKNNLQTVVSLLRRDANKMPQARVAIEAAIGQVQAVAVVHGLQGRIAQNSIMVCELLPAITGMVSGLTGVAMQLTGVQAGAGHLHVRENETVAVALVLNELATNAVKHRSEASPQAPSVELEITGQVARIRIVNAGCLPAGFDFYGGHGIGIGLGLVRALMSDEGMRLSYRQIGEAVEAVMVLEPPVLTKWLDEEGNL